MGESFRKVTVSLPEELVEYADRLANEQSSSRSAVIADLLEWRRSRAKDALAREGYAFYGDASEDFAESTASMVAEAMDDDDSAW
jgi:metal-responsive CopG/Arc/MetJ family transcriptional regulator